MRDSMFAVIVDKRSIRKHLFNVIVDEVYNGVANMEGFLFSATRKDHFDGIVIVDVLDFAVR